MYNRWNAWPWTALVNCRSRPVVVCAGSLHPGRQADACLEPSNQVSNNRHRQRRTPADADGRSFPGQASRSPGSPHRNLASGRRGRRFKSGHPDQETPAQGRCPLRRAPALSCFLGGFGEFLEKILEWPLRARRRTLARTRTRTRRPVEFYGPACRT